jgi:uncharacterized protein YcsI (UPF0317 family)
MRHWEEKVKGGTGPKTVPMYVTNIDTVAVPPFRGKMVVSMRPMPAASVKTAADITGQYPRVHGRRVEMLSW